MLTLQLKIAFETGHCAFHFGQTDPVLANPCQFEVLAAK